MSVRHHCYIVLNFLIYNSRNLNTGEIKSYLGETLTDLVNAIELAVKAHPEMDYTLMINEINLLFVSFQSAIKSRSTRNKNANIKSATEATTTKTSDAPIAA